MGKGLSALGEAAEEGAAAVGCFVAGTPVQMADGTTKPIEKVRAGDRVLSRTEKAGDGRAGNGQAAVSAGAPAEAKTVLATSKRTVDAVLSIELAGNAGAVAQTVTATRNHPFFVAGRGFVPAGGLAVGNSIVTRAGPALKIRSIRWHRQASGYSVYNFTVEGDHSYFVGNAHGGAWVHNRVCPINRAIDEAASDARQIVEGLRGGRPTRPIFDRMTGKTVGEITLDQQLVIRYPHVDRGTPVPHWNVEDGATGINWHIRIVQ